MEQTTATRMILDCDPGLDDAVAIAFAIEHADVVGVTAVGGNVALDKTTINALALCDLLRVPDLPVHAGHDMPLGGSLEHRATEFHGPYGTGSVRLAEPSRPATSSDAVGWIIETARAEEGLWIVATGPLTNIAHVVNQAPDVLGKLAGISWMGGSSTYGNTTVAAEFNCAADPEAAAIVFEAGHPNLVMAGLNVTHTVLLDRPWIEEYRTRVIGTAGEVFADLLDYYEARQREFSTLAGAAVHDALAVAAVTHPELLAGRRLPVEVIVGAGATRGMTLVDQRPRREIGSTNARVLEWADAAALRVLIDQAISRPFISDAAK